MGKQSARLYYDGKDHKDIYFQGNYHRAMYQGDKLVWMKMGGEKYAPIVKSVNGEYGIWLYYPESKSIEKILTVDGSTDLIFNGTFLFTSEPKFISRDGKNFSSHDYGDADKFEMPALGGCVGHISGSGTHWLSFDNNGKIASRVKLPIGSLTYEYIGVADYFRDYLFVRRSSGHRHVLGIFRKDGYQLQDVSFLKGTICCYAYTNHRHNIIVARDGYLWIFRTSDFSSWEYYGTTIKTIMSNDQYDSELYLSCIYDGEKYLIYVLSRRGTARNQTLLYETYDFKNFSNIQLPAYITLHGMKENSTRYLVTDEELYFENPPDDTLNNVYDREIVFEPSLIKNNNVLMYNDGIRMNPQSILYGSIYIDNLYLQDSENNMLIDFLED